MARDWAVMGRVSLGETPGAPVKPQGGTAEEWAEFARIEGDEWDAKQAAREGRG